MGTKKRTCPPLNISASRKNITLLFSKNLLFSPTIFTLFKTFFEVSFVVYWQNPHILWTREHRLVRFLNKLESGVVFFSAGCQSASSFQLPANCSFPKSSCQFVAYILKPDQICFFFRFFSYFKSYWFCYIFHKGILKGKTFTWN